MAAILKTFAGLNFYTRTCFIDYYHISFKKSHQTLRPRSCRVNQKFGPWISDYIDYTVESCKITDSLAPCCQIYRVTEEA